MKKFLLVAVFFLPFLLRAQLNFDYYALHTTDQIANGFRGWGGGMNVLYGPLKSKGLQSFPLKMQIGGGYYIAGAGSKRIELNTDATEVATFNNSQMGVYGMTRFSSETGKSRRTVYVDLLAGMRYTNATLCHVKGEDDTDTNLDAFTGFMGGAGTGILFRMGNNVMFDVGMQWQVTPPGGRFVAMNTVKNTGDGVNYQMQKAPTNILVFKVGFHFTTLFNTHAEQCCDVSGCKIRSHHVKSCTLEHNQ